jgi:glycosyltransferase involved in cell wall biosynthesis
MPGTMDGAPRGQTPRRAARVVVVHDYLTQRGGAERVLLAILDAFPGARLLTSVYEPSRTYPEFKRFHVETTWLQRFGPFRRDPRLAMPLLGRAFAGRTISDADLVICSSSGWAHGVRTDAPKLVYCHNPARWLYQPDDYFGSLPRPVRRAARLAGEPLRSRDRKWASQADAYVANSNNVAGRVRQEYGIDPDIVHPPVAIDRFGPQRRPAAVPSSFFLTISRERCYKNVEAISQAAARVGTPLVVVGGAADPYPSESTIHLGRVPDDELRWLYANCLALVAAGHEDFGLTPIEANSFGSPVLALRAGGYLETVSDGVSGLFFDEASPAAIADVMRHFLDRRFHEYEVRQHAANFGLNSFIAGLRRRAAEICPDLELPPPVRTSPRLTSRS